MFVIDGVYSGNNDYKAKKYQKNINHELLIKTKDL